MMNRMAVCKVVLLACAVAFAFTTAAFAEDATYVGNSQCKICHNKKEEGEQWNKWKAEAHSKAMETLSTDAAKAVATKAGVTKPPAEAPECLKCHVTAADEATGKCPEKIKPEDGVQCESCHGPASAHTAAAKKFKSGDKTVEPAKSIHKGDAETCKKCHNEKSPTWKADRYTAADGTKSGFDYDAAWAKINHANPAKAKK